jgi:LPS-assembly protein
MVLLARSRLSPGESRPPSRASKLKLRLAAGAAALGLFAHAAIAETITAPGSGTQASQATAPAADGLDPNSFYLEADNLQQDDKTKIATATGHVEVRYRGRTLRANSLTYNQTTGAVSASGDVVVINQDGTAEFAREFEVDKDFKAGVALAFSARLRRNVKLAADSLIRRNQDVAELNRAIYTPCDICAKNGQPKTPTWSISADKAVEDKAHHSIYYRHAVIRVLGVPIFYAPVFWSADTDVKARSGLLTPRIEFSKRLGFFYEQPYLWVISPTQDLVISPMLMTQVNPFLNLDWRKRFYQGALDVRVGYTYDREFDNHGDPIPGSQITSRSYVLAHGAFELNDKLTMGFAAERVSDDTLFDRYPITGVYEKRGLFETDSRRLLSQVYAVRQDQTSYVTISALDFQGLRTNDVNSGMPVVAPLIEARWAPEQPILGGSLRVAGSAVLLDRKSTLTNPDIPGIDSHRGSAEVDWRRAFTLSNGLRLEPFGAGRVDYYDVSDIPTVSDGHAAFVSRSNVRGIGSVGLDASYPLIRSSGDTTIILEPLAEGVYSEEAKPNPEIPDQDSADFVFDETNLFDPNRSPGFDVYDSGARLNLGGRASVFWGDGREARAFIGRSIRSKPDLTIPITSGYGARTSDWILAASVRPIRGLWIYDRTQLDGATGKLRRQEAGADFTVSFIEGYARYLYDLSDPSGVRKTVEAAGNVYVTKHWGVVLHGSLDLTSDTWVRRDVGLLYRDDCARIEVVYHHEAPFAPLGGRPSDSVQVRLTLATLGEQSYRDESRP